MGVTDGKLGHLGSVLTFAPDCLISLEQANSHYIFLFPYWINGYNYIYLPLKSAFTAIQVLSMIILGIPNPQSICLLILLLSMVYYHP